MQRSLKTGLLYVGIALLSLLAGLLTANWLGSDRPEKLSPQITENIGVPENRVDFTLPDLTGQQRKLSEWDGKVILLNFWATWCPPCRKEMPDFIDVREQLNGQNFEIIGVALDAAEPVQDFIDEIGVEYPILLAELNGLKIMQAYGNQLTTLPYTVIIDQQGKVIKAFRTEVNKDDILTIVQPLLSKP